VVVQFGVANMVALFGVLLLTSYHHISFAHMAILIGATQAVVCVDNVLSFGVIRRLWQPVKAWEQGDRSEEATIAAWTVLATLPLTYTRRMARYPTLLSVVPLLVLTTLLLHLGFDGFVEISLGSLVVLLSAGLVRYFGVEFTVRPLLERVAVELPREFPSDLPSLSIRMRLLAAAPAINVITGVVVAALVTRGQRLYDLALSVVFAVAVSFTMSLQLVMLVGRTMLTSLADLDRVTKRIAVGDFEARVLVVSTDEAGRLARSFNEMIHGLDERERLRAAFGAYVDPTLADRVLQEGADLEGEEVEVTILFLDIRDFTSFSEQVKPRELVGFLTGFWELVVPVLLEHGGGANKFIGDGLLGVFGAPERLPDHAARGVDAAIEIVRLVKERYSGRIGVGIGVNSGRVVAGTVGGGGRVEFTVIGDAVNTAARVEAATRETGDDVLITEATRNLLGMARFEFEPRPPVPLKGKREEVRLYALRDPIGVGSG
jgi:class 3 adenylate cyclase